MTDQKSLSNVSHADQTRQNTQEVISTVKILLEIPKNISNLRRTLRGEALYQYDDGETEWIQVVKPTFIMLDPRTREPIKEIKKFPNGEKRKVYIPNDEAIEELLSELFFMGMNQITPLTNISNDNALDDLKEFECKLAALLALKQVSWGMDKELMPMIQVKIKTLVQDARYLCVNGGTMKALTQQVSRIEQVVEQTKQKQIYQ